MKVRPFFCLLPVLLAAPGLARAQAPSTANAPALIAPQGKMPAPLGSIRIADEPIVRVVANVQPAVVNITAQGTVPEYYNTVYDSYFSRFRGVRSHMEQSIGSGLIISADGYILTNAHVVALAEQEKSVSITLNSGSKYRAQIVSADDDADLALLKIEDKSVRFPYFDLAYISPNLLGETVVALGSPAGYQNSVSHGILSAKNRTFSVDDGAGHDHTYANLLQTDAAINPGNSGGPLVDLNGGLVGINSAKLAGEAIENIGFAIPNEIVVPWATNAMAVAHGLKPPTLARSETLLESVRDHLGLGLQDLSPDKAAEIGVESDSGLVITAVDEESPAARAGLRADMIVVGIGDRQVTDAKTLPRELENLQAGTNVRLHVIYVESAGPFVLQRGGSVMLTAQ
jgi:serine protease Do